MENTMSRRPRRDHAPPRRRRGTHPPPNNRKILPEQAEPSHKLNNRLRPTFESEGSEVICRNKYSPARAGASSLLVRCVLAVVIGVALFIGRPVTQIDAQQHARAGTEEAIYKCDTPGIWLEGTLSEQMFYGPPGFGETPAIDFHDRVLVLKLAKPITVEPIEGAEVKNSANLSMFKHVRHIQLFFGGSRSAVTEARKLLGRSVVAVGSLDEATAPRQYTDVTMEVKTLEAK